MLISQGEIGGTMKTVVATIFLSLLSCWAFAQDKRAISAAEAGCGPQDAKFEVKSDGSQHPTPTPEDGKALIYVVADGHLTTIFGFDEKWVGAVNVEPERLRLVHKSLSWNYRYMTFSDRVPVG